MGDNIFGGERIIPTYERRTITISTITTCAVIAPPTYRSTKNIVEAAARTAAMRL